MRRRLASVFASVFASVIASVLVSGPLTGMLAPPLAAQEAVRDSSGVAAAAAPAPATRRAPASGFELWGGVATASPQWGLLGETPGMSLGLIALRWSRPLGDIASTATAGRWEWHADLVPVARMSAPLVSLRGTGFPCTTATLCVLAPDPAVRADWFPPGSPWGVGFAPLGITRRFASRGRVAPFLGVTGGALLFSERVPTTKAARFNFTASAEAGVRLGPPGEPGLTVAYRFHHLSNAGTAGENPGLASHLITVGVHRPRRSPERDTSPARPSR